MSFVNLPHLAVPCDVYPLYLHARFWSLDAPSVYSYYVSENDPYIRRQVVRRPWKRKGLKTMHVRFGGIDRKMANATQYPCRSVTMHREIELPTSCYQLNDAITIHLYQAPLTALKQMHTVTLLNFMACSHAEASIRRSYVIPDSWPLHKQRSSTSRFQSRDRTELRTAWKRLAWAL